MFRLGILGSTRGTSMQPLITAIKKDKWPVKIAVVVSDKKDAFILQRAREADLADEFVDPKGLSKAKLAECISNVFHAYEVDLIVLIGYMRILPGSFVAEWRNKIINVHPSLLPAFAGGMDKNIHQAVLDAGVKETGCTVHYVTEKVDAGPILVQRKCRVLSNDTVESLKIRVQELEGDALIEAINKLR